MEILTITKALCVIRISFTNFFSVFIIKKWRILETHHSSEATDLVEVTHPVDLSTNIFASQSEHSENFAAQPHAPATTKYKKTFK